MTLRAFIAVALLLLVPSAARGAEIDDILTVLESAMSKAANNKDFLTRCFGYPGATTSDTESGTEEPGEPAGDEPVADFCQPADRAGAGLVCPTPVVGDPVDAVCSARDTIRRAFKASAATNSFLELEEDFEVSIQVLFKTTSVIEHVHIPDGRPLACTSTYPLRQDRFTFLFAAFQRGEAGINVPLPATVDGVATFAATVNVQREKRRAIQIGPRFFCLKATHGAPTSCRAAVVPTEEQPPEEAPQPEPEEVEAPRPPAEEPPPETPPESEPEGTEPAPPPEEPPKA